MPNWCENWISINGSKQAIQTIKEKICEAADSNSANLFECLVGKFPEKYLYDSPIQGLMEEDSKLGDKYFHWYNHNLLEYGTKWDVPIDISTFDFNETVIYVSFETAWSSPLSFIQKLSEKYGVSVYMECCESLMDFGGIFEYKNGECITEEIMTSLGIKYLQDGIDGIYSELDYIIETSTDEEIYERLSKEHFYSEIEDEIDKIINEARQNKDIAF